MMTDRVKVLHEWTKDGKDFRVVCWSGGLRAEVKVTKSARTGMFEPEWFTSPEEEVYDEILRLSAELTELKRIAGEEHGKSARENEELLGLLEEAGEYLQLAYGGTVTDDADEILTRIYQALHREEAAS